MRRWRGPRPRKSRPSDTGARIHGRAPAKAGALATMVFDLQRSGLRWSTTRIDTSMTPVRRVEGRAYPWGAKNVDTDVIIPAHWLKTISRSGLGKGAFETVRAQPDNIFDDARYAGAPIL